MLSRQRLTRRLTFSPVDDFEVFRRIQNPRHRTNSRSESFYRCTVDIRYFKRNYCTVANCSWRCHILKCYRYRIFTQISWQLVVNFHQKDRADRILVTGKTTLRVPVTGKLTTTALDARVSSLLVTEQPPKTALGSQPLTWHMNKNHTRCETSGRGSIGRRTIAWFVRDSKSMSAIRITALVQHHFMKNIMMRRSLSLNLLSRPRINTISYANEWRASVLVIHTPSPKVYR